MNNPQINTKTLLAKIDNSQKEFAFYGFTYSPLTRRKLASLYLRGFSQEEIYGMACDAASGY